eukprot:gene11101-biopygen7972
MGLEDPALLVWGSGSAKMLCGWGSVSWKGCNCDDGSADSRLRTPLSSWPITAFRAPSTPWNHCSYGPSRAASTRTISSGAALASGSLMACRLVASSDAAVMV